LSGLIEMDMVFIDH